MKKIGVIFLSFLILVIPQANIATAADSKSPNLTSVVQTLIDLLDKQDKTKISPDDYQSTSLQQIITFATPAGYRIKIRYLDFGVALVEALKIARDSELRRRMIEM